MRTETSFIGKAPALLLSGALALAFSPVAFAPAALADTTTTTTSASSSLESVDTAVSKIQTAMEKNDPASNSEEVIDLYDSVIAQNGAQDALTNDQLVYIIACEQYQLDLAKTENTTLETQLKTAQDAIDASDKTTITTETKVGKPTADVSKMGKLVLSWKVSNSVDGLKYQIRYKAAKGTWASVNSKKLTKTFKNLSGGTKYTFKVRAYKKLNSGTTVRSAWSKAVSATAPATYTKGSYKVTADLLHVRKTTSSSSDLLVDILKGNKVKVTKLKLVNGVAWGKVTYGGQTGWVQMQYLKKA